MAGMGQDIVVGVRRVAWGDGEGVGRGVVVVVVAVHTKLGLLQSSNPGSRIPIHG